ncbi:hypothetical protein H6G93_17900 [Nostoc sp. FACHB-973]|nr:hypothetical protein [Nostoc sp. FACHB-973]
MAEKIVHYVPGNWGGKAILVSVCGERVIYTHASSQSANCPECKAMWKQDLKPVSDRVEYE